MERMCTNDFFKVELKLLKCIQMNYVELFAEECVANEMLTISTGDAYFTWGQEMTSTTCPRRRRRSCWR